MDNNIFQRNNADNTHASSTVTDSLHHTCHLDPQKCKQLQQQHKNITQLIAKFKSNKKMIPQPFG